MAAPSYDVHTFFPPRSYRTDRTICTIRVDPSRRFTKDKFKYNVERNLFCWKCSLLSDSIDGHKGGKNRRQGGKDNFLWLRGVVTGLSFAKGTFLSYSKSSQKDRMYGDKGVKNGHEDGENREQGGKNGREDGGIGEQGGKYGFSWLRGAAAGAFLAIAVFFFPLEVHAEQVGVRMRQGFPTVERILAEQLARRYRLV